jgi:signal transduction histidine kinase
VVAGVAGGIAERLAIDPTIVRLAFVVLSVAAGFGVIAYLILWLLVPDDADTALRPAGAAADPALESVERGRAAGTRQLLAAASVVAGMLLLLREAGLWFGDAVAWSVGLAGFGAAFLWTTSGDGGRSRLARLASRFPRSPVEVVADRSRGRLLVGVVLVVAGMATLLAVNTSLTALWNVAFAVAVTASGLGLILGPWIVRLARQLSDERRERIRSEERAEVAAHLHDSVLQTLAMIQRASTVEEMATLARGQERELRAWLYGRAQLAANGHTLRDAVEEMAASVERRHRVAVETVIVGDARLDDRLRAMVDALREGTTNAARHSGASLVRVYVEVGPDEVSAYVRDEGTGFDSSQLPPDRRGIAESITGRMERHGGAADVTSAAGEGTEVHLRVPASRATS